jgi:AraC-like DNA-binding protein
MTKHFDEKITIDLLSEKYNIAPTTLKKCFREVYGNSIYVYLKAYRIDRAAELLRDSNMEIGTIACIVGYYNASKFAGSFKSVMGINPGEYRNSV